MGGCSTGVLFISGRSLGADLGWVALRRAEFHWLFAQTESRGQPGGMLNFDWLRA